MDIPAELQERIKDTLGAWFAHLDRQKKQSLLLQEAASLARDGFPQEARRIRRLVDRTPTVHGSERLEPVMRDLLAFIEDK